MSANHISTGCKRTHHSGTTVMAAMLPDMREAQMSKNCAEKDCWMGSLRATSTMYFCRNHDKLRPAMRMRATAMIEEFFEFLRLKATAMKPAAGLQRHLNIMHMVL